ncbi:MAG: class I SAM-dependent methyltransferase [Acidimicrobiales bacterium]
MCQSSTKVYVRWAGPRLDNLLPRADRCTPCWRDHELRRGGDDHGTIITLVSAAIRIRYYSQRNWSSLCLLDVGSGPGVAARRAASLGVEVVAVDPAAMMLRVGRLANRANGLRYAHGSAQALPVADG